MQMKTKDMYVCNTSPVNSISLKPIPLNFIDSMPPFPPPTLAHPPTPHPSLPTTPSLSHQDTEECG